MRHSEPSPATVPRRFHWRRLFQYRLRTLLVITTIIAVLFGWWSYKAQRQREAVAALQEAQAIVFYDASLPWSRGMNTRRNGRSGWSM